MIRTLSFTLLRKSCQLGFVDRTRGAKQVINVLIGGVWGDVTDLGYVFEGAGFRGWHGKLLAELEPSLGCGGHGW